MYSSYQTKTLSFAESAYAWLRRLDIGFASFVHSLKKILRTFFRFIHFAASNLSPAGWRVAGPNQTIKDIEKS
jgi:hypothetical protein